jgi:FAD linked oxidases, C-terminal domain
MSSTPNSLFFGKMRPEGSMVIAEDVCITPERLAQGAHDLQALLAKQGFLPSIAGHAAHGNLHFTLIAKLDEEEGKARYSAFMKELVELAIRKHDGSLKAEHGTGINMAPFIIDEWGEKAADMMWRIKSLADPKAILAPDVILTRKSDVHLQPSCTLGLAEAVGHLDEQRRLRHAQLKIIDAITWCRDLLPRLTIQRKLGCVVLHLTCSMNHLGITGQLREITTRFAAEVEVPIEDTCCGTAGDRGLLHPELVASATRDTKAALDAEQPAYAYLSANRTCEMGLLHATGHPYQSFVYLLEELNRPTTANDAGTASSSRHATSGAG